MIIKNEIPILEFDSDFEAVISPRHDDLNIVLPKRAVFAFLGESVEEYALAHSAKQVALFESETKDFPIFVTEHKGEEICLAQAPVGSAASAQLLDFLIGYGVESIISAGCCGALTDIPEGAFLVPARALRDEGTSYHYAPPSRYMEIDRRAVDAIVQTLDEHGVGFERVTTWTTDGFYRETKAKVEYRKQEGCSVVEMECSALAACAQFRNALFGQILYTADTLADIDNWDKRNWGCNSKDIALKLCLDAVLKM
ncbi:MAG: nucleoside phosphorylase [Clostridia bacterium]|nr:nucleoside phosphorylase [Clostridia bacterium]